MYISLIIVAVAVIFLIVVVGMTVKRYKRCPSDALLVIYGKTGKSKSGEISTAKVLHGGGAFVWPIIQDYEFLNLQPQAININLKSALSKQNIRIDVPSTFTIAISSDQGVMINAAERLLGMPTEAIAELGKDIIFGQLRLVIATMDIEEINSNRDAFYEAIQKSLEPELAKVGLKLINVNITDITDESGYIDALGKEAAAVAINEAKKSVAEKNRNGEIGVANAKQDERVQVAAANTKAQIGEALAAKDMRIEVAENESLSEIGEAEANQRKRTGAANANASAIEGENVAAQDIAKTTAHRKVIEAEALKESTTAINVNAAEALEVSYEAEQKAEKKRGAKEEAKYQADVIVPEKIKKEQIEIAAEAKAEQIRRIAKGEADAIYAKMEAEARGINEILTKRAEGFKKMVEAAGGSAQAVQMMITDNLEALVETQVKAISNINFDKITVWDSGNGNGGSSTADFAKNILGALPPFTELFKMAGTEVPAFLQGTKESETAKASVDLKKQEVVEKKKRSTGPKKD